MTHELLIIGGGPAGLAAARAYRSSSGRGAVGIVTDERRVPYNRPPLSKELLRAEIEEDELPLETEQWFSEHEIDLISTRAVTLDPDAKRVMLSGGRELAYKRCVLSTGGEPTRLPVPGADDPAVRVLRGLDDLRELRRRLEPDVDVCVIGSGFIGCEVAASLRMLGHDVCLISDEPAPNQRRLGDETSARIRGWLEALGVSLNLGCEVQSIERTGDRLAVRTERDRPAGSLVVMATGVSPRAELAAGAGLSLEGGAIPTDSAMSTEAPDLFAAGDVCVAYNAAAGRRLRVEHWGDALGQGKVAGSVAAGKASSWDEVPGFWSTIGSHTLKYAAWGDGFDDVRFEPSAGGSFTAWYGRDSKLVGVLAHRADEAYERGREMIAEGAPWAS
jgi:3-phenylpropionate/trans-cinnamate dioxygenase ferredoxin reductase component